MPNKEGPAGQRLVGVLVSAGALALAVVHVAWPDLELDSVTLALLAVAALPWLAPLFKSIELPGIGKFEFQEFKHAVNKKLEQQDEKVGTIAKRIEQVESIVFTGATSEQAAFISGAIGRFAEYLHGLGIDVGPPPNVSVLKGPEVSRSGSENAYYRQDTNEIVLHPLLTTDSDVVLREYGHHVLISMRKDMYSDLGPVGQAIESGLADYLSCSFSDDPVVGERAAVVFREIWGLDRPYIRNLKNTKTISTIQPHDPPQVAGEVWGGAFWDIRERLGLDADAWFASAWAATPSFPNGEASASFAETLLNIVSERGNSRLADDGRAVLARRRLSS